MEEYGKGENDSSRQIKGSLAINTDRERRVFMQTREGRRQVATIPRRLGEKVMIIGDCQR